MEKAFQRLPLVSGIGKICQTKTQARFPPKSQSPERSEAETREGGEDRIKRKGRMRERARINAMRSGVVVLGALAFGYLTLQVGFRPFLERAQKEQQEQQEALLRQQQLSQDASRTFSQEQ